MRSLTRLNNALVSGLNSSIRSSSNSSRSSYVCRQCIQQRATQPRTTLVAQFSTSTRRAAAVQEKEADEDEGEYIPATTWHGLEWVGNKKSVEQQRRPKEPLDVYGKRSKRLNDKLAIRDELIRAIIEVFTLKKLMPEQWQECLFQPNSISLGFPSGIRIGCEPVTREMVLDFASPEIEEQFSTYMQSFKAPEKARFTSADIAAQEQAEEEEEGDAVIDRHEEVLDESTKNVATQADKPTKPVNRKGLLYAFSNLKGERYEKYGIWSSIDLHDMETRFAVVKRVLLRTGIRLQDPRIGRSTTVGDMFLQLWSPEPPKKLALRLETDPGLKALPNVKLAKRRVTRDQKEREMGRLKVIQRALKEHRERARAVELPETDVHDSGRKWGRRQASPSAHIEQAPTEERVPSSA